MNRPASAVDVGLDASPLRVLAGPRARVHLREHGLRPQDVHVIAGAAGGPKGLTLLPLDQFLFGRWLADTSHEVHLVGASIGAWRMATACRRDAVAGFEALGRDYIHERYGAADDGSGRLPTAAEASRIFSGHLQRHFGGRESEVMAHPRWRLHVLTSHGRGLLQREGRWRTPLGYGLAVGLNAVRRAATAPLLERVLFSSSGSALPLNLGDLRSVAVPLSEQNLQPAILASCSIPFWLQAVHDIPGAPPGAYWDGGITDYHVHLDYASMNRGGEARLALIPHFQPHLVPGWLDKPLKHRHRATPFLDNAVVLCPSPTWVRSLPGGKLPDRTDFKTFQHAPAEREARWREALRRSDELAVAFERLVAAPSVESEPLP